MLKLFPILTFALLLSGWAYAEPEHGKKDKDAPPCAMNPGKFLKEEIGLTDDQQKKLEAIRLEHAKEMENVRHDIEVEKLSIKELAVKGTLTKVQLKASLKKIEDARNKMHAVRYQGALSAIDIFTDEQIKKIAEKRMLNMLLEGREGREEREGHEGKEGMGKGCPMMEKGKMDGHK